MYNGRNLSLLDFTLIHQCHIEMIDNNFFHYYTQNMYLIDYIHIWLAPGQKIFNKLALRSPKLTKIV